MMTQTKKLSRTTQAATPIPRLRIVAPQTTQTLPFEEKLALLLLMAADGSRALIEEAIRAVACDGESTLRDVLNYIAQRSSRSGGRQGLPRL
jgi:hypothetical protein